MNTGTWGRGDHGKGGGVYYQDGEGLVDTSGLNAPGCLLWRHISRLWTADVWQCCISTARHPGRASFEQGGEGGRGFWTQNLVYQKWPDQIFPIVNFVFSDYGHFGLGRGEGGFGGGVPPPWFLIILKKPCIRGCRFIGECGVSAPLLTIAATASHGIHTHASADRLHIQSFPGHEKWTVPSTNDVGGSCNTGPGGSESPSVTHQRCAARPDMLSVELQVECAL